jgi:L-2-hydroxyglutarate oxidase
VTRVNVGIVGSGIIGLAIGRAILEADPSKSVVIYEKESTVASHASGRNSGVMHAGFYYSPDSLKAKFCREGNRELRSLISRHGIPIRETGKVVVAKNEKESLTLVELVNRGTHNSVDLELLSAGELHKFEPLAVTHNNFIWSPTTAVSDPRAVASALELEFEKMGGQIIRGRKIVLSEQGGSVCINQDSFECETIINSAGTGAINLAHSVNAGTKYQLAPFRGDYIATNSKNLGLRTLVYPVPSPTNPFLGVHFTLSIDGSIKLGPTAVPLLGREQYSGLKDVTIREAITSINGLAIMLVGGKNELLSVAFEELRKKSLRHLVNEAKAIVPSVPSSKMWYRKPPGIRAQLLNRSSKSLENDFVVEKFLNSLHILNAVSPGWTSAIPFGRYVADMIR